MKSILNIFLFFIFTQCFVVGASAQQTSQGESLFKQHCTSCHDINIRSIGPPLKDVHLKYDKEWLYSWIANSTDMVASGDEQAVAIYEEYNKSRMDIFEGILNEQDIDSILLYIENASSNTDVAVVEDSKVLNKEEEKNYFGFLWIILVLGLLIFVLDNVKNVLKSVVKEETQTIPQYIFKTCIALSKNKNFLFSVFLLFVFIVTQVAWNGFSSIGVYDNYQPTQPIKFSHKIHAGDNGIDCNYCHHTARNSKHAGIPSANLCMNCHTFINSGSIDGDVEINKIYESVGFDPESRSYIDKEKLNNLKEELLAKEFMLKTIVKDSVEFEKEEAEIKNIKKKMEIYYNKKPIEWVRVHTLPDLAYFNHSQHVNVGKLECKTCHGPVEKMDEVYQFADLTMEWCLDCHKNQNVQYDENKYYENYLTKIDKAHENIKVKDIGGLECGKCHY